MNIKYVLCIIAVWGTYSFAVDLLIAHEIDSIREEITQLRKVFSYDPKDAK